MPVSMSFWWAIRASNVMAGHETTLPITLDQNDFTTLPLWYAIERSLVVVDLPFGSYQSDPKKRCVRLSELWRKVGPMRWNWEGGKEVKESIKRILNAGIPVMGHLGLTPQSIYKFGTYSVRAKERKKPKIERRCANAGAPRLLRRGFGKVPAKLAGEIAQAIQIPVIGIGAGGGVDGQVLVMQWHARHDPWV